MKLNNKSKFSNKINRLNYEGMVERKGAIALQSEIENAFILHKPS